MATEPKLCLNVNAIMNNELRAQLDHYLVTRSSVDFLQRLPSFVTVSCSFLKSYYVVMTQYPFIKLLSAGLEHSRQQVQHDGGERDRAVRGHARD